MADRKSSRLRYFKEALEYDASKEHAADYLKRTHNALTIPQPLRAADGEQDETELAVGI